MEVGELRKLFGHFKGVSYRFHSGIFEEAVNIAIAITIKTEPILFRRLVSEETVVVRRWGSETRKFGLSTDMIM